MIQSIKNTLIRLSGKIYLFNPIKWYPEFIEGISKEFARVRDYKNNVLSATVVNDNMTPDAIDDHNKKYGIPSSLTGSDAEKISRLIEKADPSGWPGPDYMEEQLAQAGYDLYVHENSPQTTNVRQYGNDQYSPVIQYGLTQRYLDPDDFPGYLCVGSPPSGEGRIYLSQYSTSNQYGNFQYGTPDPNALNPQPKLYEITDDPQWWGFYFVLSPFEDRLAVDESEFLEVPENQIDYLCDLIVSLKHTTMRAIVQAKSV